MRYLLHLLLHRVDALIELLVRKKKELSTFTHKSEWWYTFIRRSRRGQQY